MSELPANPDKYLFIVTRSTMAALDAGDYGTLTQTHLADLDKPRRFGKGRGHDNDGTRFRLFDDDGNLYWEGVMWDDGSESQAFAPLNWAMGDSGCTTMKLWEARDGVYAWRVL